MSNQYDMNTTQKKPNKYGWLNWAFAAFAVLLLLAVGACTQVFPWQNNDEATATPVAKVTVLPKATQSNEAAIKTAVAATVAVKDVESVAANTRTEEAGAAEPSATPRPRATTKPSATPQPAATEQEAANPTEASVQTANIPIGPVSGGVTLFDGTRSYDSFVASGSMPTNPDSLHCATEAQIHQDLELADGVKVVKTGDQWSVPTDPCKFSIQAVGIGSTPIKMASNYQFTVVEDPDQQVVVYYGDDVRRTIQGATVRYLPGYTQEHWVWNPEALISQEFNFGFAQGREPRYITKAGNFNPEGWDNYDGSYCPRTQVQLAAAVGGWPANWTPRTEKNGADMFAVERDGNNNPLAFYILTDSDIQGSNTWVDYQNVQAGQPARLENGETYPLADAAWHCDDATPEVVQTNADWPSMCFDSPAAIAAAIGGNAADWHTPDASDGAWVYGPLAPMITVRIPSIGGSFDHWKEGRVTSGSIDGVDNVSYKCPGL